MTAGQWTQIISPVQIAVLYFTLTVQRLSLSGVVKKKKWWHFDPAELQSEIWQGKPFYCLLLVRGCKCWIEQSVNQNSQWEQLLRGFLSINDRSSQFKPLKWKICCFSVFWIILNWISFGPCLCTGELKTVRNLFSRDVTVLRRKVKFNRVRWKMIHNTF